MDINPYFREGHDPGDEDRTQARKDEMNKRVDDYVQVLDKLATEAPWARSTESCFYTEREGHEGRPKDQIQER